MAMLALMSSTTSGVAEMSPAHAQLEMKGQRSCQHPGALLAYVLA